MNVLIHNGSVVSAILSVDSRGLEMQALEGNPVDLLRSQARQFPVGLIGWCRHELLEVADFNKWEGAVDESYDLVSWQCDGSSPIDRKYGYVDFTTPYLVGDVQKASEDTWMVSNHMGVVHCSMVNGLEPEEKVTHDLKLFLNILGLKGSSVGWRVAQSHALMKADRYNGFSDHTPCNTVKLIQYRFGKKWLLMYFLNCVLHERLNVIVDEGLSVFAGLVCKSMPSFFDMQMTSCDRSKFLERPLVMQNEAVDVIIPTLGRAAYLTQILDDLSNQTFLPTKVIVVDQGAPENKVEILARHERCGWKYALEYIVLDRPGACRARNVGLDKVDSRWVFLADDDIRIEQDTLRRAMEIAVALDAAVTIEVFRDGEQVDTARPLMLTPHFGSGSTVYPFHRAPAERFDERLDNGFGEDVDFGMALRRRGIPVYLYSGLPIYHYKAQSGGFRFPVALPWSDEAVVPRPSPTVLRFFAKNMTTEQYQGYKTNYLLKRMARVGSIFHMKSILQEWNASEHWVEILNAT